MEFLVLAYDETDADALNRRLAAPEAHLDGVREMKREGTFLEGGAILDDGGRMIGSMVLVNFPSRQECEAWIASDPYTTGGVWKKVQVLPFRRAPV